MSNASASSIPGQRGDRLAPTTPAAGPESSARAACAAASSSDATPPDERITSGSGRPAPAHRVGERAQVAAEQRAEVGVGRGGRGALVLPELRRRLVRGDDVRVRVPAPQLRDDRLLVRRVAEGEEQADGDRLRVPEVGSEARSSGASSPSGPDPRRARRGSARAGRAARDGRAQSR